MNYRLGRLGGIPIVIDFSWFCFAPIIAVLLTNIVHNETIGIVGTVFIYLANLGHEASHCAEITAGGGKVKDILIMAVGTIARVEREPDLRGIKRSALAGPLYSLILGISFFALGILFMSVGHAPMENPAIRLTFILGAITIAFGAGLNMLPIWPLDGGVFLRAVLHERGYSSLRTASLCLGLTVSMGTGVLLYLSWRYALSGNLSVFPKAFLALFLISSAVNAWDRERERMQRLSDGGAEEESHVLG